MKIAEARSGPIRASQSRTRGTGGGDFAGALGASDRASATGAAAPVNPAAAVLAAQEVGDPGQERKRARARAEDLLDRLDSLRLDLLAGEVPESRLAGIQAMVKAQRGRLSDPRLIEILDEIDLRAAVELAKLGRF